MIIITPYWSYYDYDYDYDVSIEKFLFHIQFFRDDELSIYQFRMFFIRYFRVDNLLISDVYFLYSVVM